MFIKLSQKYIWVIKSWRKYLLFSNFVTFLFQINFFTILLLNIYFFQITILRCEPSLTVTLWVCRVEILKCSWQMTLKKLCRFVQHQSSKHRRTSIDGLFSFCPLNLTFSLMFLVTKLYTWRGNEFTALIYWKLHNVNNDPLY